MLPHSRHCCTGARLIIGGTWCACCVAECSFGNVEGESFLLLLLFLFFLFFLCSLHRSPSESGVSHCLSTQSLVSGAAPSQPKPLSLLFKVILKIKVPRRVAVIFFLLFFLRPARIFPVTFWTSIDGRSSAHSERKMAYRWRLACRGAATCTRTR